MIYFNIVMVTMVIVVGIYGFDLFEIHEKHIKEEELKDIENYCSRLSLMDLQNCYDLLKYSSNPTVKLITSYLAKEMQTKSLYASIGKLIPMSTKENGPSHISPDGTQSWYVDGKLII